ncbi:tRNA uridine(34) 5-carboxymethylaminomethyl modification radical SAM/GNAT enzyme Elp3 [Candidatus Kuenenbacteria bacterium HGW-Kuenenbacteria-1]|uniref:tRNA carboxymethyluridine synthase n=1 Tax=Candidatus Kuenenbacteria bacterium HGW-Kuenenbacteria-1 TaxID=2013812 RepID=A0A2N1UP22_9BACT|nr:MAG: tRNA uridine(34) 5-carboxymethylaminomethyl modification radical SAM/GNAT enzyme Elp3 [Candidatus Kuenenbacteria bacterium HGW-Kuenenbacteria-1]
MLQKIIKNLIKLKPKNDQELSKIKRKICKEFKMVPFSNSDLFEIYQKFLKEKKISKQSWLENLLKKHPIRTLSGVAVVAILTKPYPCPGKCFYCPTEKEIPKSYLSNEPAVMRAVLCKFDPYKQIQVRLKSLEATGHPTDKVELIIMGGTWTYFPERYQNWFIKRCFDALNNQNKKKLTLKKLQKINEKAKHRCVALTLETRPDFINLKEIKRMRELGCTKVELGVQALDDSILQFNIRGHKVEQIIQATKLLKDAGFKVCYHMMPNLPGSTLNKDFKMFEKLFNDFNFKPDLLKIYPCVVTKNSELYYFWKQGKYQPYSTQQLINLLIKIKTIVPRYVRIIRVIRDIPSTSVEAGNKISNLREIVQQEMEKQNLKCQCIRCRQVKTLEQKIYPDVHHGKQKTKKQNLKLFSEKYEASNGIEYFLSFEDAQQKNLYAFLRLRILHKPNEQLLILKNAAIIREVHTYGQAVMIGEKDKKAIQHFGLGKKLIFEAEKIVQNLGIKKICVISGIGVREYYRKLGYRLKDEYMVKFL